MRAPKAIFLCGVAITCMAGCEQWPKRDDRTAAAPLGSDAVREAIERVDVEWEQAANGGNAAGVARLYAAEGRLMPPNSEIILGPANIQTAIQGLLDAGMRNVDFRSISVGVAGDLAYEIGEYSLDLAPPKGPRISDRGKYVIVLRKQSDGSWKIVADIFNTNQPIAGTGGDN